MFESSVYINRRKTLKEKFDSGLILFLGNDESPANYAANTYIFRQDSTFLYYFGVDRRGFAATIDIDNNLETLFGDDNSIDEVVWTGPQSTVSEIAEVVGVKRAASKDKLAEQISAAIKKGRRVHFLPQYRIENKLEISNLAGVNLKHINNYASEKLIKAVVAQRSVKSTEEITELDEAVDIASKMHLAAMKMAKPESFTSKSPVLILFS